MIELEPYDQSLRVFEQTWTRHFATPLQGDQYRGATAVAEGIFAKLSLERAAFVATTVGAHRDQRLGDALDFSKRILGSSVTELSEPVQLLIFRQNQFSLDLGLLTHLIGQTFPDRHRYASVDTQSLFRDWLPQALIADRKLVDYDRMNRNLPSKLFDHWLEDSVARRLKSDLLIGFWKRHLASSLLRSYYFAGIDLGLNLDLATSPEGFSVGDEAS